MAIQIRTQLRAELRRRYLRLRTIPGQRWNTLDGQLFLHDLHRHVERYGQRQLAEALGISHQGVSRMLARHDPSSLHGAERLKLTAAELSDAYVAVKAWRALGRVVRRRGALYFRMHEAVDELSKVFPVATIARLTSIPTQELARFMDRPEETSYDDATLLALIEEYDGGRALTGPRRRAFLSQLEETLASPEHPLVEVAHLLGVAPRVMRTWLVERTHGKHPD